MIYYLLLAWWKRSKLCLKINHQQSSVTFTGLRWLGTGGLAGTRDVLAWWISHLNSFGNVFTVLVLPPVMATIQRFIRDVTLHFSVSGQESQNILSLLSAPLAWVRFIQRTLNGVSFEYFCSDSNKYFLMTWKYLGSLINALLHIFQWFMRAVNTAWCLSICPVFDNSEISSVTPFQSQPLSQSDLVNTSQ